MCADSLTRDCAASRRRFAPALWLLTLPLMAAGCDAQESPSRESNDRSAEQAATDSDSNSSLPVEDRVLRVKPKKPLGDYLPPLEGGRLEIAPPDDWKIMGRKSGYVTRFYRTDPKVLPLIVVTVEPSPFDDLEHVTEENVKAFARRVAQRLDEEGTKLLEPVLPMIIGPHPAARYVTVAHTKGRVVERQILVTLADGQYYTVDLRVLPRTIKQHKEAGYAVLAGMKFSSPSP